MADFNVDAFLAEDEEPEFDVNSFLGEEKPARTGEAALQGFGETASLGYLPQLQAATEPATFGLLNLLTGKNVESAPYEQRLQEYQQRSQQLGEEAPGAMTAGKAAGIAATIAPGARLAGLLGGGARGAAGAAGLQAGAAATGEEIGSAEDLKQRAMSTGLSTGVAGALGQIGRLGKALSSRKDAVRQMKEFGLGDDLRAQLKSAVMRMIFRGAMKTGDGLQKVGSAGTQSAVARAIAESRRKK